MSWLTPSDACDAVERAHEAGFFDQPVDPTFGYPGMTEVWKRELVGKLLGVRGFFHEHINLPYGGPPRLAGFYRPDGKGTPWRPDWGSSNGAATATVYWICALWQRLVDEALAGDVINWEEASRDDLRGSGDHRSRVRGRALREARSEGRRPRRLPR